MMNVPRGYKKTYKLARSLALTSGGRTSNFEHILFSVYFFIYKTEAMLDVAEIYM